MGDWNNPFQNEISLKQKPNDPNQIRGLNTINVQSLKDLNHQKYLSDQLVANLLRSRGGSTEVSPKRKAVKELDESLITI